MRASLTILAITLSVSVAELTPEICATPGLLCASCSQLASCILADGEFTITHLAFCNNDESCYRSSCTTEPLCDYGHWHEFRCNTPGMYPDPLDCRKYHYCVPNNGLIEHYPMTCNNGYGYNSMTTHCSKDLVGNACSRDALVPICREVGDTGPLSNPSLYYVCAKYSISDSTLYPFAYACPHGGTYDDFVCATARGQIINSILSKDKML